MAAYLVFDVDDLLSHFRNRGIAVDLQELAVGLRGGAALAAGLMGPDKLKALAIANWKAHREQRPIDLEQVFKLAGYDTLDIPNRDGLVELLVAHYFAVDPDPVDELILATTNPGLLPIIHRVKRSRNTRVRVWGSEEVVRDSRYKDQVVFQPLESLLGIQTKNVAVYIDFENIAISLNEQGFIVNLDHLIDRFVTQAKAYGQVVKIAAYAPWGQRGTLPPLVDSNGREIADEAPSRLALANIDPVFNLPGKNSADVRIARDMITDASHSDAADVYIIASGDRDFNDVLNTLVKRNLTVVLWGVRGSTSRMLAKNGGVTVEYIDDFTNLQTHQSLRLLAAPADTDEFTPSQWTSVIVQFDRLAQKLKSETASIRQLVEQLQEVGAVVSRPRGEDLVSQAISLGILKPISANGQIMPNANHPIVEKTRLIRDRIVRRVENTLQVRGWEYVNYGFLLKGLAMDKEIERPGFNGSDQWRSHWIDALVREQILERQLVPHRHNPDDLVPVIKLCDGVSAPAMTPEEEDEAIIADVPPETDWTQVDLETLMQTEREAAEMVRRIVVSVEQFTSFRNFAWCPLGSLHRRLRGFDTGMSFQRAVEYLVAHQTCALAEYNNPQSTYSTKGISLDVNNFISSGILEERDEFILYLLALYDRNMLVSGPNLSEIGMEEGWNLELWFSIMETENVLNALPGRPGQYSLFRTHHTVNLVADKYRGGDENPPES